MTEGARERLEERARTSEGSVTAADAREILDRLSTFEAALLRISEGARRSARGDQAGGMGFGLIAETAIAALSDGEMHE